MTLAVANAIINSSEDLTDLKEKTIESMVNVGRKYPDVGYGPKFYQWIITDKHEPYESFGNGAAMRISPVGVFYDNIEQIKEATKIITDVSHNHIDSEKGSEAVAIAIFMALNNKSKEEIKQYIEDNYFIIEDLNDNNMSQKLFHINCVETVKQALDSFMKSYNFEGAIRNAISLGGDSDTIAAITGGIAAAYYGIPEEYCLKVLEYLDEDLISILKGFNAKVKEKRA